MAAIRTARDRARPVPGYQAPQDTITPAGRVAAALIAVVKAGPLTPAYPGPPLPEQLKEQAGALATALGTDLSEVDLSRALISWTQLFGSISFELFGQYVGGVDPADAFFEYLTGQMADFVG